MKNTQCFLYTLPLSHLSYISLDVSNAKESIFLSVVPLVPPGGNGTFGTFGILGTFGTNGTNGTSGTAEDWNLQGCRSGGDCSYLVIIVIIGRFYKFFSIGE